MADGWYDLKLNWTEEEEKPEKEDAVAKSDLKGEERLHISHVGKKNLTHSLLVDLHV